MRILLSLFNIYIISNLFEFIKTNIFPFCSINQCRTAQTAHYSINPTIISVFAVLKGLQQLWQWEGRRQGESDCWGRKGGGFDFYFLKASLKFFFLKSILSAVLI